MASVNSLETDIKKLFEDHTLKELEQIQKQIQHECDRKQIELRTLVGERYRDLIQAADTIADMRKTSGSVVCEIAAVEDTFRHLQEKYLIGFKIQPENVANEREHQGSSDLLVLQIKMLMDIPEQIWSAIDSRDFLQATELFMLAQYINYGLTFEIGNAELANKYPIVAKQWSVISQFKNAIFNGVNVILESFDLETELAANCLASLALLDSSAPSDLLNKLISLRSNALKFIVVDENHHSVRNRIKLCIKVLTETVTLVHKCFIKDEGLVAQHIRSIKDIEAATMFFQLDIDSDLMKRYFPPLTNSHKPFAQVVGIDFSLTNIPESLQSWLNWVKSFTAVEVTKLLNLVTSVKGIHNIREEALAVRVPESWNAIWDDMGLPPVNFWAEYFQPLLTKRVKGIMDSKIEESLSDLQKSLNGFLEKVSHEKCDCPEHDLRWYVWKDSAIDVPPKLSKTGSSSETKSSLFMKTRGFSPNIVKLCSDFDRSLLSFFSDLEQYLYEADHSASAKDDLLSLNLAFVATNKFSDREEIQEYLQNVGSTLVAKLIKFTKEECVVKEPKRGRRDVNALVVGRFYQALIVLSPNLTKCFALSKIVGVTITNSKWQSTCDRLREESVAVFTIWAQLFQDIVGSHRAEILGKVDLSGLNVDAIVSDWEKVTIEEEAEEGKRIKSEILVPYQASVALQDFLAAVCGDLNKVIPHSLSKMVHHAIIDNVVVELFSNYSNLSTDANLRQKQAIQLLFDVKYFTMLMVPRENKPFVEKSNEICNNVVSKIDPFDLDVFYPFIHVNVKKAVQRSLLIFGNLVPHLEQLHSVLGARSEHSDVTKAAKDPPGVLAVCSGAPWFPPLAVVTPSRNLPLLPTLIPEKAQKKKTPTKEHNRNDSTGSTIKSGAAAFFGAMGSDWFGTS